ncbi:MAG: hypothetical protein ACQESJ_06490 [Bacteroidota bacterium]
MKTFFLTVVVLFTFLLSIGNGQDFIGKSKDEIKKMMKESKEEFYFSKEVNTGKYHFLKFENMDETKTMLFMLSDDEICEYTKLMCDYSLLKSFEDSLNSNFEYQQNMEWIDYSEDTTQNYLIELEKKDWFFTIKTSPIKN